jgi:antitoxin CcdA
MRKSTNLSLDQELISNAKALDINLSRAAENGIRDAIARIQADLWQQENKAALESSNAYVEQHGLPLASVRQF